MSDEYFSETCGCVIRDGQTLTSECDKHGFLAEVERRAGASVEEMREWLTDKKSAKLGAAVFLRRILEERGERS